jgi:hypothetical protein
MKIAMENVTVPEINYDGRFSFFYQGSKVNCDMEENCSDDLLCSVIKVEPEVAMIRVDQE